jgi:pimeloyl-ACP methyl ester carboxylesterase
MPGIIRRLVTGLAMVFGYMPTSNSWRDRLLILNGEFRRSTSDKIWRYAMEGSITMIGALLFGWDAQMMFFLDKGYRVIAHDRRGHGRSTQTANGHDMDTHAADVARVVETLDLKNAIHIGHSTGGGEVTRYVAKYGKGRVAKAVLISAIPPTFMKSDRNPDGVPREVVDGIRDGTANHRSQFYKDITMPFYGFNRPGAKISEGIRENCRNPWPLSLPNAW